VQSSESFEISEYFYQSKKLHILYNRILQRERWQISKLTFEELLIADQVQSTYSLTIPFYLIAYDVTFSDKQRHGRWEIENASYPILTEE